MPGNQQASEQICNDISKGTGDESEKVMGSDRSCIPAASLSDEQSRTAWWNDPVSGGQGDERENMLLLFMTAPRAIQMN
jgi:hypothetical protein